MTIALDAALGAREPRAAGPSASARAALDAQGTGDGFRDALGRALADTRPHAEADGERAPGDADRHDAASPADPATQLAAGAANLAAPAIPVAPAKDATDAMDATGATDADLLDRVAAARDDGLVSRDRAAGLADRPPHRVPPSPTSVGAPTATDASSGSLRAESMAAHAAIGVVHANGRVAVDAAVAAAADARSLLEQAHASRLVAADVPADASAIAGGTGTAGLGAGPQAGAAVPPGPAAAGASPAAREPTATLPPAALVETRLLGPTGDGGGRAVMRWSPTDAGEVRMDLRVDASGTGVLVIDAPHEAARARLEPELQRLRDAFAADGLALRLDLRGGGASPDPGDGASRRGLPDRAPAPGDAPRTAPPDAVASVARPRGATPSPTSNLNLYA